MNINEEALKKHGEWQGKIEVVSRVPVKTKNDLSVAYTPGVAAPCLEIKDNPEKVYSLTRKSNLVAVITDGSAVLGLGNIGPEAGMPVMEGKCVLFKEFAGIDAFPLCINSNDADEIVNTIYRISDSFGGINLEDISAPRCFEIEEKLKKICRIPVFHDDQHGTAVVVAAALINALKVVGKKKEEAKIVINGAGSAGCAICRHLLAMGFENITLVDRAGIICEGDDFSNPAHRDLSAVTNRERIHGILADAVRGADVFIGVSVPGVISKADIGTMAPGAVVFPMANPVPEIMPEDALSAGATVVGTGRSDYKNQINNLLAFPGIFRGALDSRASEINEEMKVAASLALASLIPENELSADNIIISPLDKRAVPAVAAAVADAARRSGVARL